VVRVVIWGLFFGSWCISLDRCQLQNSELIAPPASWDRKMWMRICLLWTIRDFTLSFALCEPLCWASAFHCEVLIRIPGAPSRAAESWPMAPYPPPPPKVLKRDTDSRIIDEWYEIRYSWRAVRWADRWPLLDRWPVSPPLIPPPPPQIMRCRDSWSAVCVMAPLRQMSWPVSSPKFWID